jgi:hypothetical protein
VVGFPIIRHFGQDGLIYGLVDARGTFAATWSFAYLGMIDSPEKTNRDGCEEQKYPEKNAARAAFLAVKRLFSVDSMVHVQT